MKKNIETMLKTHIAESSAKLSDEESNFELEELDLIEISNNWKKHIDQLKVNLKERKEYLNQTSGMKKLRLEEQEKLLNNYRMTLTLNTNAQETEWNEKLENALNQLNASKEAWNETLQVRNCCRATTM